MKDIAATGIAKMQKNQSQGYYYRGIEAAMNELSPLLVKHGISVTPSYSELTINERVKGDPSDGKATRFCTIKGSFKFESSDGSFVSAEAYGEAMDSGDKAVVKAQSVSFRTALFQEFVIPTMAMDPESYTEHDVNEIPDELLEAAKEAAKGGWKSLADWTKSITAEQRALLSPESDSLKKAAKEADAMKVSA